MSMNRLVGSAVCVALLLLGTASSFGACGGDSGGGGGGSDDGDSNDDETNGSVAEGTIVLKPSKLYTAYDGQHEFAVPVVAGVAGATWTASDPSAVDIEPTADGALIKVKKGGVSKVTVTAKAGVGKGSVEVFITQGSAASWEFGKTRYNNGVAAVRLNDAGRPMFSTGGIMLDSNASCNFCHGVSAMFVGVEHTPLQLGGFTDEEVVTIFTMAKKPEGAPMVSPVPANIWMSFHKWTMTEDEKAGILLYLRSLAPKGQAGFRFPTFDGGRPPGLGGTGMTTTTDAGVAR
jgi:hypothetical protein